MIRRGVMASKKVFRIPIVFMIEFRLFFLFFVFTLLGCVGFIVNSILDKNLLCVVGFTIFLGLIIYAFKIYLMPIVFPLGFGKLIITDKGVEYHCIFTKNIFLSWDDCEFCGIESYKNDIKDLYKTGRVYIYFSKNELSQGFCGNITKKKNSSDFIKFFPVTVELCETILCHKNYSDIRRFVIQKSFGR